MKKYISPIIRTTILHAMTASESKERTFIETICVRDGVFERLPLHQDRMDATCREAFCTKAPRMKLSPHDIPEELRSGKVKCRVVYGHKIESIAFQKYEPRHIRSLKIVHADELDYHLKYTDRSELEQLRMLKGEADEVVIVRRGLVTDTSYSNLLFRASDRLLTPRYPLLRGVMRENLLRSGVAEEADITEEMLRDTAGSYITEAILINAMLAPGEIPPIPWTRIF